MMSFVLRIVTLAMLAALLSNMLMPGGQCRLIAGWQLTGS